jgi:hypothetical protein
MVSAQVKVTSSLLVLLACAACTPASAPASGAHADGPRSGCAFLESAQADFLSPNPGPTSDAERDELREINRELQDQGCLGSAASSPTLPPSVAPASPDMTSAAGGALAQQVDLALDLVITGVDALSRSGDLPAFQAVGSQMQNAATAVDLAMRQGLPPDVSAPLVAGLHDLATQTPALADCYETSGNWGCSQLETGVYATARQVGEHLLGLVPYGSRSLEVVRAQLEAASGATH